MNLLSRCLGSPLNRRNFLHVGAIGALGLTLDQYMRLQAAEPADKKKPKAEACIHIFMPGGQAHQESWDPKPFAPVEYRGQMGTVKTKIEGEVFNECLVKTAAVADQITVCRAMTHGEAAHERGTHNMFTGYRPSPALKFPSLGSVVSHELGVRNNLPPYVAVPTMPAQEAGSGYLSSSYAPFSLGSDPANGGFRVQDLALPGNVTPDRFATRRTMLDAVNAHFAGKEKSDNLDAMDTFYQRAYGLISSEKAREAFDINKEDAKLRDEYGRNAAGQRMLMARRLVESGVRFVTMTYGGWDLHGGIVDGTKSQLPQFDQAFATLVTDLKRRGLFDSTLIMVSSEFGRTPKINATAGRDHWPKVFSVVLAGGGIKKGFIYGKSDSTASEPDEDGLTVEDLAHTVYHCLGIDADKKLMSPGDRPIDIVREGKTRKELVA
ncbi:DUF1501 domain-containing protein [Frigoriglobus tundricola]|uniref:Uncharacterized DUF1501 protein, type 2 n=1 Tax=Frigoriglobus tundricola TaxID=2774151 RepID=A0A6M5YHP0_9BACT|nr:DUF1501 domain-containing protein [Frigoriglobus tundricola]QJW93575.1 Uncharacterized DUF1501 protein, type 2 [Frigoriglobus tundricola]